MATNSGVLRATHTHNNDAMQQYHCHWRHTHLLKTGAYSSWTHHREGMAEEHQKLGQNFLPHLTLELDQSTETGKHQTTKSTCDFCFTPTYNDYICQWDETYTDIQAESLETSLLFLISLQRFKRSTQSGWLGKQIHRETIHISDVVRMYFSKKEKKSCLLLLCGEDFKGAVSEHVIEHSKKWNTHPRKRKTITSVTKTKY